MASPMLPVVCLFYILMHCAAGSLRMDVSPSDVLQGLTESLTVNCSFSYTKVSNISGIISLIVSKSDEHERFVDLVSLNAFTPDDVDILTQINGQVSGHIDPEHESYLSVVLPFPKDNNTGLYMCEMHGMDNHGHPSQLFQTSLVTSHEPTIDQVINKVIQLQHQLQFQDNLAKNQSDEISECQAQLGLQENLAQNQSEEIIDMEKKISLLNFLNKALRDDDFYISEEYNGHYYLLSKQDWNNASVAEETCENYGCYLAQINDDKENQFLKDFLNQHSGAENVLVSGSDEGHEGRWTFTGTDIDFMFYDWATGQPNSGVTDNCLRMSKSIQWQWDDGYCIHSANNQKFACELS